MIRAEFVRYNVGEFSLDLSLDVADREYFVLLGATGSGKTLFLECLCGLHRIRSGRVVIGGRDVTDAAPAARHVGYVPQDGVLFHHLDVRGNIVFSLKVHGAPRRSRDEVIWQLAAMLGIERLLSRRIPGLSGGERQRVALARALACRPSVLLLDEPVSALDEFTRDAICGELAKLKLGAAVSVIHVCHSVEEARLVADRVGVIEDGRIVQTGTLDELMSRPANRYVANILRLENVFSGRAIPDGAGSRLEVNGLALSAPRAAGDVEFLIRPWEIEVAGTGTVPGENMVEGLVSEFSLAGALARLRIDGALPLLALIPRGRVESSGMARGQPVRLVFNREAVHVFEGGGTVRRDT